MIAGLFALLTSVVGLTPLPHAQGLPRDSGSGAATVSSLIPELTQLPETRALHIDYEWEGLDDTITIDYLLALKGQVFDGQAVRSEKVITFGLQVPAGRERRHNIRIPREAVSRFLLAVLTAHAEETEYKARIDHTDDYPRLAFEISGPKGKVLIATVSQPTIVNGHLTRAPWGILYDGRTLVVSGCEIDLAFEPFSKYLWSLPKRSSSPFVAFPRTGKPPSSCG